MNKNMNDFDNMPVFNSEEEISDEELSQSETDFTTQNIDIFGQELIKTATSYIGVSRDSNLPQIARFLQLFNLPTKLKGKWVPFCAGGISFAACKTYCLLNKIPFTTDNAIEIFKSITGIIKTNYFLPSPSCGLIMENAQSKGTWIPISEMHKHTINPGYLILYNWHGGTWPNHIGIVEKTETNIVHTIEFNTSIANNTNGGAVSRRTRNYNCVLGFVRF